MEIGLILFKEIGFESSLSNPYDHFCVQHLLFLKEK